MDRNEIPKRPWWRKRRWLAVGVLWLIVAYPVSLGPYCYAVGRGWLPKQSVVVYAPIFNDLTEDYGEWLYRTGLRHAEPD